MAGKQIMIELRETIDTQRNEEGWVDFPIYSKILLDDTRQILIKMEGPNPDYSYLIYNSFFYNKLDNNL